MSDESSPTLSPLVAQLYDLDAQIEALKAQRALVAKELIDLGEGQYVDAAERKALVIVPTKYTTTYDLYRPAALAAFLMERKVKKATAALLKEFRAAQETRAEELAGEHFKALFDRTVLFPPTKGFADLVPKLLTNAKGEPSAKARDILLHCQIVKAPGDPYVKLPDKPKKSAEADADDEES